MLNLKTKCFLSPQKPTDLRSLRSMVQKDFDEFEFETECSLCFEIDECILFEWLVIHSYSWNMSVSAGISRGREKQQLGAQLELDPTVVDASHCLLQVCM